MDDPGLWIWTIPEGASDVCLPEEEPEGGGETRPAGWQPATVKSGHDLRSVSLLAERFEKTCASEGRAREIGKKKELDVCRSFAAVLLTTDAPMRYEIKGDTYPLRHCFPPFGLTWDGDEEVYWTADEEEWREAVGALGKEPPDGSSELTLTADLAGKRIYPVGYRAPDGEPTHYMCSCSRREMVRRQDSFTHVCRWYELEADRGSRALDVCPHPG
jgi:hypothetical protein